MWEGVIISKYSLETHHQPLFLLIQSIQAKKKTEKKQKICNEEQ